MQSKSIMNDSLLKHNTQYSWTDFDYGWHANSGQLIMSAMYINHVAQDAANMQTHKLCASWYPHNTSAQLTCTWCWLTNAPASTTPRRMRAVVIFLQVIVTRKSSRTVSLPHRATARFFVPMPAATRNVWRSWRCWAAAAVRQRVRMNIRGPASDDDVCSNFTIPIVQTKRPIIQ